MRRVVLLLILVLLTGVISVAAEELPGPSGPADQVLGLWQRTAKQLTDMAEDFPEDKYDFKPTPEVRSFREQLLHVAGANYFFLRSLGGQKTKASHEGRETKADVVAVVKESFADGEALIREMGDAGLSQAVKHPFADQMISKQTLWMIAVGHGEEHYGQLVVYYRLNGIVPPASRNQ